jgi:hypothetical protein
MAASTAILHEGDALILCESSQGYDSTHCHVSIHCWELMSQWRVMVACPGHHSLALRAVVRVLTPRSFLLYLV